MGRKSTPRGRPHPNSSNVFETISKFLFYLLLAGVLWKFICRLQSSTGGLIQKFPRFKIGTVAYVIPVCREEDALSASILVYSVLNSKSRHDVAVLTRNLSSSTTNIFTSLGVKVDPFPDHPPLPSIEQITTTPDNHSLSCFYTKSESWRLIQYSKIILLDPMMLVIKNIDHLFSFPEPTAAPDNHMPDRFNPSLMVIAPNLDTHTLIQTEIVKFINRIDFDFDEVIFMNSFFPDWPELDPQHRLPYGYNADSSFGYSATWNEWVEPKLKVVRFSGKFERWNDVNEKSYPSTRRYDHMRWKMLRNLHSYLTKQGEVIPSNLLNHPHCHSDYMLYSQGSPIPRRLTVLIHFHIDINALKSLVYHYCSMKFVHEVMIRPVSQTSPPTFWNTSKPVVILDPIYGRSDRFTPIKTLATDCVLVCEDTVTVSSSVLWTAFRLWSDQPYRIMGFFPSAHYRDAITGQLVYVPTPEREFSMVGSRLLIMHADYFQSFTCTMPGSIRRYIDRVNSCEDIALNFLASQLTNQPPNLMTDPDKYVWEDASSSSSTPHSPLSISTISSCLNDFESILKSMPLQNTTDSKMHLEHDLFSKMLFQGASVKRNEPDVLDTPPNLTFEPIFESPSPSAPADENYRFMSSLPRITSAPEVVIIPSLHHPNKVLCLKGLENSRNCSNGWDCSNAFAVASYDNLPPGSEMLLGTTVIVHSRYGFDDRFHTPNIVSNLFFPYPDYSFMKPSRILFYRRGSLELELSRWGKSLIGSVLGEMDTDVFLKPDSAVCFEKTVMTRRYRAVTMERKIVLREAQERASTNCMRRKELVRFSTNDANTVRLLLLVRNVRRNVRGIENLDQLIFQINDKCELVQDCEFIVVNDQNFADFCQQIVLLGSASIFMTMSGDSTMNHVIFMKPGNLILEIVPYGIKEYDPRVMKTYREASRWLGLNHSYNFEKTGPDCPAKNSSCRFLYRQRPIRVNVRFIANWFYLACKSLLNL